MCFSLIVKDESKYTEMSKKKTLKISDPVFTIFLNRCIPYFQNDFRVITEMQICSERATEKKSNSSIML